MKNEIARSLPQLNGAATALIFVSPDTTANAQKHRSRITKQNIKQRDLYASDSVGARSSSLSVPGHRRIDPARDRYIRCYRHRFNIHAFIY